MEIRFSNESWLVMMCILVVWALWLSKSTTNKTTTTEYNKTLFITVYYYNNVALLSVHTSFTTETNYIYFQNMYARIQLHV